MTFAAGLTEAGQRAEAQLVDNPARPDKAIAAAAGVTPSTVWRLRRQLEASSQILRWRWRSALPNPWP